MEINAKSKEIIDIKNEVEKEVKKFRKTITKEPCQKYFEQKEPVDVNWNNKEVYIDALYQGYLDACRTIQWNRKANEDGKKLLKAKKEWDKERDKKGSSLEEENPMREPLKEVAEKLQKYFKEDKEENKETFNKKHTKWCNALIKKYSSYLDEKLTYGQAQKIINMTFKYLYCIFAAKEKLEEKKEKFKYCHMPLDKFSLEWVKRYFKKGSVKSWSHMEEKDQENKEYGYNTYSKNIEEYCEQKYDGQISPLQLDFIVWSKMQKIMAAEAFIKTFKDEFEEPKHKESASKDYDVDKLEGLLKDKMDEIKALIGD